MECKVRCPFCREKFSIEVYKEDGENQDFVWDCEVCCHPIDISAHWDQGHERFSLRTGRDGWDEMPNLS